MQSGFQALNSSISNDFATPASGSNIQAVALYTTGDQTVLENVRLHGFQDTLYVDSPSASAIARVYIKSSFIEGDTDFIFGRATGVIDGSTLHYLSSRKGAGSGVLWRPVRTSITLMGFWWSLRRLLRSRARRATKFFSVDLATRAAPRPHRTFSR